MPFFCEGDVLKLPQNVTIIILAAGMGTRMKSSSAKVLHEIFGRPMIMYVVEMARRIAGNDTILVVGNHAEKVRETVSKTDKLIFALQEKQLGTGHAVLCALPYINSYTENVVILSGDVPLLTSNTVMLLLDDHIKAKRDISLLAVEVDNPKGYGRILLDENRRVYGVVEEADATEVQKMVKIVNTGIYCVKKEFLLYSLQKIRPDNIQGELYLTDIVKIGHKEGKSVGLLIGNDYEEVVGINNRQDLIAAEAIMRKRVENIEQV